MEIVVTVAAALLIGFAVLDRILGSNRGGPKKPGGSGGSGGSSDDEDEQDEMDWDTDEYN